MNALDATVSAEAECPPASLAHTAPRGPGSQETEALRAAMTYEITCWAAAAEIAALDFPSGKLPQVAPLPAQNLGHMALFNYNLFAKLVWVAAIRVRDLTSGYQQARVGIWLVAILAVPVLLSSAGDHLFASAVVIACVLLGLLRVQAIAKERLRTNTRAERRRMITSMLQRDVLRLLDHPELKGRWIQWGDGSLGKPLVPVLAVYDPEHPFPGFGKVTLQRVLILPSKEDGSRPKVDVVSATVMKAIVQAVEGSGFRHVTTGRVVVLDGQSLRPGSPWLTRNGDPLLWLELDQAAHAERRDPNASARAYLTVQVLFPEHLTAATCFVRVFQNGTGVALELQWTSLGPPDTSRQQIQWRGDLLAAPFIRVKREEAGVDGTRSRRRLAKPTVSIAGEIDPVACIVPAMLHPFGRPAGVDLRNGLGNWRDDRSLAASADMFGSTEVRAAQSSLTECVARTALDALRDLGFDTSEYRDRTGNTTIFAGNIIESMMMADNAYIGTKGEGPQSAAKKPASEKATAWAAARSREAPRVGASA